MQLSLIPDLVADQPVAKSAKNGRQLSLNILGSVAATPVDKREKQPLTTATAWYNGRLCTVTKRFTENIDGLTLKLCRVKFDDGTVSDIPADHLTVI